MFDVTAPYEPSLRHPDPNPVDFTAGSTSPDPAPLAFNINPLGTVGTDNTKVKIVGAGTPGVDGEYVQVAADEYDGPGDCKLVVQSGYWTLTGFGSTLYDLDNSGPFPFSWLTRNGDDPAPTGSF